MTRLTVECLITDITTSSLQDKGSNIQEDNLGLSVFKTFIIALLLCL